MKTIMILGASVLQLPAIIEAREMGLHVVVADMNPEAIGFSEKGIEKEFISTIDIPAVLEAAKRHKIDGIMTLASDMPVRTVAVVAGELRLVGVTEETAIKATNKAAMRDALKAYGVPVPMYFKVENIEEFLKAVNEVKNNGHQCIVKPTDNSGSRGVELIQDYSNENLLKVFEYSKSNSRSGGIVVEEYMTGPEISVETLAVDGEVDVIQITDKLTTGAPYFVETGHNQPSRLNDDIKEKVREVAILANKAIGIENGPSHTEMKITDDGPKIVEIGARLGGDNITTHLVPLSTGINMVNMCIKIALGEKPRFDKRIYKASAIRYINVEKGRIIDITGLDEARRLEGVKQISIVHGVGDMSVEIKSSVDRPGFIIAQADDTDQAISICEKALSLVRFEVDNNDI